MRDERKILIAGTGRCGTTFLIKLLTLLGFDTGLTEESGQWFFSGFKQQVQTNQAGLPIKNSWHFSPELRTPTADLGEGCEVILCPSDNAEILSKLPRYIKDPRLHTTLPDLPLIPEHVFVLHRDLLQVAQSKRRFARPGLEAQRPYLADDEACRQESARQVGNLMTHLVIAGIAHTSISFHRMVVDARYLYQKLDEGPEDLPPFPEFEQCYDRLCTAEKDRFRPPGS